ncbi:CdaR family transcriptional regulator [Bacillus atrophaeus]|uniref:CdaR family transcriptional regulator n=1 Tax=Bacillus atrophaeus TaxID=1452 RepID=UPI001BA7F682|nr:sugar diacid recognition domain-containing protein [Bacillus atrophaeus]MCY8922818.1 helix-turn-helix domain-containing protein [Bacillus atrophaeus]QUF64263.1 helix-turn-helix domain-containing protein [Bacillus atrophaeus]
MLLQPALAKKIIAEVKKMYDREVIIVNTDGSIIASTNDERIGGFHEGALICAKEKRNVIITKEDEKRLRGVKSGLNLPVFSGHHVTAVFGLTGEPEEIQPYGELLRKMTELFIKESRHLEQIQWQARTLESFMIDWLQLREWSPGFLEKAQLLGVDLTSQRRIILIQGEEEFTRHDIEQMTHLWKNDWPSDLFVRWGNERILINHEVSESDKKEQLLRHINSLCSFAESAGNGQHVSAGVGQAVISSRVIRSYEQAEKALSVSIKRRTAVCEEDLKLDMCLADIRPATRGEFSRRVLQKTVDNEELMKTMRTLFSRHLSLKQTAETLHIHINTLRYRLEKLENLTGCSFNRTEDIVTLYLALYFLDDHTNQINTEADFSDVSPY